MLNRPTLENYRQGLKRLESLGLTLLAQGASEEGRAAAKLFRADAALLTAPGRPLEEELFGPATVLVAVRDLRELMAIVPEMGGHLTASLFAGKSDLAEAQQLLPLLEERAGRLILNDFPTGVEVCEAMVHGGPWPATSDSRSTSVGTLAIDRFLRPVCYQGYPAALLPPPLKDIDPLN